MSKRKEKEPTCTYHSDLYLPKPLKKKEDRDSAFTKFLSLLEEDKESFAVDIRSNKRRRQIILDSENFMFTFSFGRRPLVKISVNDPDKNKATVNEIGNKIVSYFNTIFGEVAVGTEVLSRKVVLYDKKIINLAEKLLGTGKIAKIGEFVKQTLRPFSISFEYRVGEKDFLFTCSSFKKAGAYLLISSTVYKDKMPFNLLEKEITELDYPVEVIKKLAEMEL